MKAITYSCSSKVAAFPQTVGATVRKWACCVRASAAKIILLNWAFSLCGLLAGCSTIDAGSLVPGFGLVAWFVLSSLVLIERKDTPEMQAAADWLNNILD